MQAGVHTGSCSIGCKVLQREGILLSDAEFTKAIQIKAEENMHEMALQDVRERLRLLEEMKR